MERATPFNPETTRSSKCRAQRPGILPEDHLPLTLTESERRTLTSHSNTRLIWGEGNPKSPLFIILDNPGAREDSQGQPFLCGTRETLLSELDRAGIPTRLIYVTYLLKSRPVKKYDKEAARAAALPYLTAQIQQQRPRVVLCLGDVVIQTYFNDPAASAKACRGRPHQVNGLTTVVSYHPLAVRRRPNLLKLFQADLSMVRAALVEQGGLQD